MLSLARWLAREYRKYRLLALGHRKTWQRVGKGLWMLIDPDDPTDQSILFRAYERSLIRCIYSLVRQGEICVDIGAEKGYITLHLARAVGPSGRVLAFEPDPRALKELSQNLERNGLSSVVTTYSLVLSDKEGACDFHLTSQLGNSTRFPNKFARQQVIKTITLPTRTLDKVLEEIEITPDHYILSFVKIDTEGSEPLILKGCSAVLNSFRPAIWLEINRPSLQEGGFSDAMIEKPLRNAGYTIYRPIEFRDRFLRLKFLYTEVRSLEQEPGDLFNILAIPCDEEWQMRMRGLL